MRNWIMLGAVLATVTAASAADLRYGPRHDDPRFPALDERPPPPPHWGRRPPDDGEPPVRDYAARSRPRCWIQPGPWGPERVCGVPAPTRREAPDDED